MGEKSRIAVLCGPGPLPRIIINAVVREFGPVTVIEEDKEPTRILLRRRLKLLGPVQTLGQFAFGFVLKPLHRLSAGRKREIMARTGLDDTPCPHSTRIPVPSVNSEACREALRRASPDVVLVVGTRMIRQPTLGCIPAPFINYHAGINPKYRGMNGGYWALAQGDPANAGVTMHLVDQGVDTGGILYTAPFAPESGDNFVTYPLLQAAAASQPVLAALHDALAGRLRPVASDLPSRQWFHPTLWGYFGTGLARGVW